MCDGRIVRDPIETDHYWRYNCLEWWASASTGLDFWLCRVEAEIDGDRIKITHHGETIAVAWFTLDEMNGIGMRWRDVRPQDRWIGALHGVREA